MPFVSILRPLSPMFAIFGVNFLLVHSGLHPYDWFWVSPLMHTLGGVATAWTISLFFIHYQKAYRLKIAPKFLVGFCLVAAAAVIGILWEWYELLSDVLLGTQYQPGIVDTLTDLVMDMIGAAIFALYLGQKPKHRKKWQRS